MGKCGESLSLSPIHFSLSPRCSRRVLHSSNFTFSRFPGWSFVDTEGWQADLVAVWAVGRAASSASVCVVWMKVRVLTSVFLVSGASHMQTVGRTPLTRGHKRTDATT